MRRIFRKLTSLDEARKKLSEYYNLDPLGDIDVNIDHALNRVVAENIVSEIDVPGFNRSQMDGFAVKSRDTFGADDATPKTLQITGRLEAGEKPKSTVNSGQAVEISTGAVIPKGADAVIMVEYTSQSQGQLQVFRSVNMGENVVYAGSDIITGELVIRKGTILTPKDIGILAAIGRAVIKVYRQPKVAILSTGNEVVKVGQTLKDGQIFDINAHALAASVQENMGEVMLLDPVGDDPIKMKSRLQKGLNHADIVLTSGSTSAGVGDILYRIIDELGSPGIIVHGVSLKPGKPTIIAVINSKLLIGLPGYPTSCLTIFQVIVAPIIRRLAGLTLDTPSTIIKGKTVMDITSVKGRLQLLPVSIEKTSEGFGVIPSFSGSSAITTLALNDGFITIPSDVTFIPKGTMVNVELFTREFTPTDLFVIGSNSLALELLLETLLDENPTLKIKNLNVGSTGGLVSLQSGVGDFAGIHIIDEKTGDYNIPALKTYGLIDDVKLISGFKRKQGLIVKKGNPLKIKGLDDLLRSDVSFINRNSGSGTRILLDKMLKEKNISSTKAFDQINGYWIEVRTHQAVASNIKFDRADAGLGIETVAILNDLDFIPLADESFDFVIPKKKLNKPAVESLLDLFSNDKYKTRLKKKMPWIQRVG